MDANHWMGESSHADTDHDDHDDHVVEPDSLGERIDRAIGELDAKLARLHKELDLKRTEVTDLEALIEATEKQQAKAFKDLLSNNPKIKKIIAGKSKRKSSGRRRKTTKPKTEPEPETHAEPREPDTPGSDLTYLDPL